jgi:hypothetical protein
MTAKEPLTIKLGAIKEMIAAGLTTEALEELTLLLADGPMVEAYILRMQILVQDVRKHVSDIVASLNALAGQTDDSAKQALTECVAAVAEALSVELREGHEKAIGKKDAEGVYDKLKVYEPLGIYIPYIYLVLGHAVLVSSDVLSILESILESRNVPAKPSEDTIKQAKNYFEKALKHFSPEVAYYAEAAQSLASLYEQSDAVKAFAFYKLALDAGAAVKDRVKALLPKAINTLLQNMMIHIDAYILMSEFDKASNLLNEYSALEPYAFYQLRWGDYYLLSGDYAAADRHYDLCESATFTQEVGKPALSSFSVEALQSALESVPDLDDEHAESVLQNSDTNPWLFIRYKVDPSDFEARLLCGRLASAWQQGDFPRTRDLIQQLARSGKADPGKLPLLLQDMSTIEVHYQQFMLENLRLTRQTAFKQADWVAFRDAAQAVVRQAGADAQDSLWLAAALYKAGDPVDSQVYLLRHLSPDLIRALPPVLGRELLRGLGQAGVWEIADRFVDQVANAGGWRASYQHQREAFLAQAYADVIHAYDQALYEQAAAQTRQLLTVEPSHAEGRLLLGRLRLRDGFYAEARQIAEALVNEGAQAEAATALLVQLDMAEGYLLDAEERLHHLSADVAESLRLALRNRLEQRPYVQLETVDEVVSPDSLVRRKTTPITAAIFAVELKSVRAVRQVPRVEYECFTLMTALERSASHTNLQVNCAWRYIAEAGRLQVFLLCRVEAATPEQARFAADSLWQTIHGLLPLQDEQIYSYEPVTEPNRLAGIRMPEALNSAIEITRQEVGIRNGEKGDIPLIHPFQYNHDDLHRVLRLLLEQSHKTVLDIHFQPTALFPWERSTIQKMLGEHSYASSYEQGFRHILGDERYYQAMQIYPKFLTSADWMAFVTRIHVASVGPLSHALPNAVATGLFGPSRYTFVSAMTDSDLAAVQRNLHDIAAERWGYTVPVPRLERLPYLLTVIEALSATRLPVPGPDGLPGLPALKVRATLLPSNLPTQGTLIGEGVVSVRGRPVPVRIGDSDRMRHAYVVGRTGTGKSTLLQNMALQDIEAGHGVAVIDPHGDLVEAILERMPPHRVQDVVLFDPSDTDRPIGLNTLNVSGTFEQNMVVSEFIGLMYTMFDPNNVGIVGPRFENAVRNAMLTAMAVPGNTLIEVVRILSERSYLKDTLAIIDDPVVKGYWEDIVGNMSDFHKSEVLDYITSKFGRFITDHLIRNIIGQSDNALDFADIMDSGKILLVNLAKGKIGPQNSHFLGLLLVPRLLIAALSRARMGMAQRRLFCLYVDEFHNFTTPAFSVMLSEARKYGIALTMANQFISQLDNSIRESVFGNVGTLLAFQLGVKDAQFIVPEMYPVFDVDDMVNLPNYHLFAKMLVKGAAAPQFALRTLPDTRAASSETANAIRELSRQRYGRDVQLVTHEITQRFKLSPKERLEMMRKK